MNILEKMDLLEDSFTKTDYQIYIQLKKDPQTYASMSITELMTWLGCSQASLTRFAKKMGFNGFSEFQYQFALDMNELNKAKDKTPAQQYGEILIECERTLQDEDLRQVADMIKNAKSIHLAGASLSQIPCNYMEAMLNILGYNVKILSSDKTWFMNSTPSAIMILFSVSRGDSYKQYVTSYLSKNPQKKPKIVLVTMNPKHTLRKYSDKCIVLPHLKTSPGSSLVYESMCFLLFVDMLSKYLN